MKKLIVNADDFGLSPGINRGIVEAFQKGIVSSSTMLVNMPSFKEAACLAKENDLPCGIHLNFLWGKPVSESTKIPTLVNKNGEFLDKASIFAKRCLFAEISIEEVKDELTRQIEKFLETGLNPTHLDTHKHIHSIGAILDAILEVAAKFNIDKIRNPSEKKISFSLKSRKNMRISWRTALKRNIIKCLCRYLADDIKQAGFKAPEHFVGFQLMDKICSDKVFNILNNLEDGTTEIMCHPGYFDDDSSFKRVKRLPRERELAVFCDSSLKEKIRDEKIQLISFKEL